MIDVDASFAVLGKLHVLRATLELSTSSEQGRNLMFAVRCGNYKLLYDDKQNLIGYVIWAAINRDGWRMLQRQQPPKYLSEWSEGIVMLPLDIVVLYEWRAALQTLLRPVCRQLPQLAVWRKGRQPRLYRTSPRRTHD